MDNLSRAKYAGLDFDTHFDDLLAQLQSSFASTYNDYTVSSLGVMLLDLVSYALDAMSFYLDRRASDDYLITARTRKAVSKLCRQLGYKMRPAIASSVDLQVSLDTALAFQVLLPKGFKFSGPNGLVFEAAEDTNFDVGLGPNDPKSIPCYEGETFNESFVSDGTSNQLFQLRRVPEDKFVVFGSVQILVDSSLWVESEFLTFDQINQYEVGYNDDPPSVRFGDGVAGNIPTTGATIQVRYVASRGKSGQVGASTIQAEVSPLVANFQTINLTINNPLPSVGGDDAETIDHAKAFAGRFFKSRQVAITREDYEALAGSYADPLFGRVAAAQAVSSRSAASDLDLLNNLLIIRSVVEDPVPTVMAEAAAASASLATVASKLATIATLLSQIAGQTSAADTQLNTEMGNTRLIRGGTVEIQSETQAIQGIALGGVGAVNAVADLGSADTLSAVTKDAINAYFNRLITQAIAAGSAASTVQGLADGVLIGLDTAKTSLATIGLDTVTDDTYLVQVEQNRADAATASSSVQSNINAMKAVVIDTSNTVDAALTDIYTHVDRMLAADALVNLVSVPILTNDASGFYAAPTASLIQSLQTYLDARKEVTQTVQVASGEGALIKAVLTVRVGVLTGYSQDVVRVGVETALDGLLRGRKFGDSLFVSEITAIVMSVAGTDYCNVTIDGYTNVFTGSGTQTDKLDPSGNLIIDPSQVVSKDTVTVNVETSVDLID